MSETHLRPLRRVVISGLGVVAPNGIGKEEFWQACISGRSGIRHITRFDASQLPSQVAGEITDFAPEQLGLTQEEILHMDRATQFALAAANLAIQDANFSSALSKEERERIGVYMGLAMACLEAGEQQWALMTREGRDEPSMAQSETIPPTLLMSHAAASGIEIAPANTNIRQCRIGHLLEC